MLAPPGNNAVPRRIGATATALVAVALVALAAAGSAAASAKTFSLGFDIAPTDRYSQTKEAGADVIRIDVDWDNTSPTRPVNPTDPADPTYSFGPLDQRVQAAAASGLRIMLTVARAPGWAAGANPPANVYAGTWKPDAKAFGAFAQALATRYSGTFTPLGQLNPLPQVRVFEAWNEPNLGDWLYPQYDGKTNKSVEQYRKLLNAFYEGIHAGDDGAQVIGGATGPFGETPQAKKDAFRTRPLTFTRDLLCLNRKLKKTKCKSRAKFDIWSHHPINVYGSPRVKSLNKDDLSAALETTRLKRIIDAAEKQKTVGTKGNHPLWATEMWWETNPPDPKNGFPLADQARFYEEAFYLLNRAGFETSVVFQFIDSHLDPDGHSGTQSGVLFEDGSPKPSYTAVRFPFVTDRLSRKKIRVWTVPPVAGELEIQERHGKETEFKTVRRVQAQAGKIVQENLKMKGRGDLRGVVGAEQSLNWFQTTNNEPGLRIDRAAPSPVLRGGVPDRLAPYAAAP